MGQEIELVGFPSYEQAREAAQKLDIENIPCRISRDTGGMFSTLYVAQEDEMRAAELVGADGVEVCNLIEEEKESPESPTEEKLDFEKDSDRLARQVSAELKSAEEKKKNPMQQLTTLIITIVLFASMGLFSSSVSGILILIGVIFIHEMGHLISMRLLRYKDVQMFFIPLFGAAVSGVEVAPSGTKKAVVSLMGPAPGIIIGIGTAFLYMKNSDPLLGEATRTLLFINAFNLLPFHPLDGGRFFDAILFSRHPKLELVFKILTTLALGGMALMMKSPLLGIFSFFSFMTLKTTYSSAKIAYDYRKKSDAITTDGSQDIPEACLQEILPQVKKLVPDSHATPKLLATHASAVWQRIQNRPSSIGSSIGLTLGYVLFLLLGIVGFFLFVWISYAFDNRQVEIVSRTLPDGIEQRYSVTTIGTHKRQEFELEENDFFHGKQTDWHLYTTNISKTGQWTNGFRTGEFILYDLAGEHAGTIIYENGNPLSYQLIVDGDLVDVSKDEWPTKPKFFQKQTEPVKSEPTTNED